MKIQADITIEQQRTQLLEQQTEPRHTTLYRPENQPN
jgi:hypothetical protein